MSQEHNQPDDQEQQDRTQNDEGRSIAEWTTLGISIAILVAMIGLITYLYVRGADESPVIVVETKLEALRQEESGYYLPVEVSNEGDKTVENVTVAAELDSGGGEPETAVITVAFLAGGEHVQGTFVFGDDPSQGELTVGATSYQEP